MSGVVVLHVGLMKSGTTFVQQQLFAHQADLAGAGILVPGKAWGQQVAWVRGALHNGDRADWARLTSAVAGHDGRAVVSVELLGPATRPVRRRVVESLRPHRVEVVITARDLNRGMVSLWQETVQNGRTWTWQEYVEGVRAACPPAPEEVPDTGRTFWRQQDLARIAGAWGEVADRVSVVTVPPPGADRDVLLDRFSDAAGLPRLAVAETTGNESLGLASVLALREVNELLNARDLAFPAGRGVRKRVLAKEVLAARRGDEPSLGLDVPDWLAAASEAQMAQMRTADVDLFGDWAELTPVPVPGVRVEDVADADVRRAAVAGLAGLLAHLIGDGAD